jgi:hypothetical protein
MSGRSVPLPSPAMAVALCALFVALGGASYALTLPRDSRLRVRRPVGGIAIRAGISSCRRSAREPCTARC